MERGYKKFLIGKDGKEKFEIFNAEDVEIMENDKFSAEKKSNGEILLSLITKKFLPTRKNKFPKSGKHVFTKSTILLDEPTFKSFVKFANEFESCIS